MTDLHQINPKLNPYFQNLRIRRVLINAGLINRQGDILNSSLTHPSKGRRTKENLSKTIHTHVVEEEKRRIDLSAKDTHVKKNKTIKRPPRSISPNLSNIRRITSPINEKHSPKRAKSAYHLSRNVENRSIRRRSAKEKSPAKSRCRVIMTYYGPQTNVDYDKSWFQHEGDEIVVMQQHCGGENLTVFKGYVKPNETFAFDSQRHTDYPFALALYINGFIDCRVSVCCEHKHKLNVPLGGSHGSFAISDVQKAKPCLSCRYIRRKKKSKSATSLVLEPSRYKKSIVPRLPLRNTSHFSVSRSRSNSPPASATTRDSHPEATPSQTSILPLKEDQTRSPISSNNRTSTGIRSPSVSRTPTPPLKEDHKRPKTAKVRRNLLVVPTDDNPSSQGPDVSQTPTLPPLNLIQTGNSSNIQNPVSSQKNNENYSSDFDETNDEDNQTTSSRFGRPRISDTHSIDKDQEDYNTQSSTSFKSLNSSHPSDDPNKKLTGKENTIGNSRKSSSSISRKSDSSEDEVNNYLSQILTGKTNVNDDSRRSSSSTSKKSDPSPSDKIEKELNNQFSLTTTSKNDIGGDRRVSLSSSEDLFGIKHSSATKKNEDNQHSSKVHRTSSNSSEEFFGIKRSSEETNKNKQALSKDWFETNSNRNDQLNLYSPPKTNSWRTNIISNQDD